jgi:hypothetical protein
MRTTIAIYAPGSLAPLAHVTDPRSGSRWRLCADEMAALFSCHVDQISAPDLYWGGEWDDDETVDGILIDGRLVATFKRPISSADLTAIYASRANAHANLRKPLCQA